MIYQFRENIKSSATASFLTVPEIKGHVTDFRKSVHVPDFQSLSFKALLQQIMLMNNPG
jgi:hypothetical protein